MSGTDRYQEGSAHGRGPGDAERPEHVLGDVSTDVSKEASRKMYLQELRARIDRDEYEIDPDEVAGALVERLESLSDRLAARETHQASYVSAEVVEPQ
jgi:hypothetical protein